MGILYKEEEEIWEQLRRQAEKEAEAEPILASYLNATILVQSTMESALAFHLSNKLSSSMLPSTLLYNLLVDVFTENSNIRQAILADIRAVKDRDPACVSYLHCVLNFKGFLGCQAHRVAHRLWSHGRFAVALAIQSRFLKCSPWTFILLRGLARACSSTMGRGLLSARPLLLGITSPFSTTLPLAVPASMAATGIPKLATGF